jgi:CelD/BcsL family acetyltransferase involved in cellulose biosynthesis
MDMTPDPALHDSAKLLSAWEELARDTAEPNCFYAPEMLLPALQHLAGGQDVRLIEAWRDGLLIGLFPVTIAPRHGRFPIRNVTNWVHRHCFFGAPLIRRGHETDAWNQFLSTLDAAEWAPGFLHLMALDEDGANAVTLHELYGRQGRGLRRVHRYERALLQSELSADAYWESNVRAKKRKEIRRLQKRLQDMGEVKGSMLAEAADLERWCDDFLRLEKAGWKGAEGTAMACTAEDATYFRDSAAAAFANGRLMFLRLDLDGRPIAMLVNFRMGEGGFSFKIAFDEAMSRFSPGVLIELDNLARILDGSETAWMDSCAAPGHPMIDSLWAERRSIVQYRIELKGYGRSLPWTAMRVIDGLAAQFRACFREQQT